MRMTNNVLYHLDTEVNMLNFLTHNRAKIMYAVRHRLGTLYSFDVDNYVDIVEILKKKQFKALEDGHFDKNIIFTILEILSENVIQKNKMIISN